MALTNRPADEPLSIVVDWQRCDGNGVCAELLPELLGRDDWGYPVVAAGPVPPQLRRLAVRARSSCPAAAFTLQTRGEIPEQDSRTPP